MEIAEQGGQLVLGFTCLGDRPGDELAPEACFDVQQCVDLLVGIDGDVGGASVSREAAQGHERDGLCGGHRCAIGVCSHDLISYGSVAVKAVSEVAPCSGLPFLVRVNDERRNSWYAKTERSPERGCHFTPFASAGRSGPAH